MFSEAEKGPGVYCERMNPAIMEIRMGKWYFPLHINKKLLKRIRKEYRQNRTSRNRKTLIKIKSSEIKLLKSQLDKTKEKILN